MPLEQLLICMQVLLSATMHSKLDALVGLSMQDPVHVGFRCNFSQAALTIVSDHHTPRVVLRAREIWP